MRFLALSRAPSLLLSAALILGACAPSTRGVPSAPSPVAVEPEELGDGPEIAEAEVRSTAHALLGDVAYDLPLEANTWVEAELNYLVGQRAAVIGRWLERGDFYEAYIKTILANEGLPTDLFHLAMIESGFVPAARSRAGAVGLWQFMPATGRMEGLRVDDTVDERLDPVRSTVAAARHLRTLHRSFRGDWALAAAAYNAGSGRISRGMQGFGATNFWDLAVMGDLAEETKHYVPRLYAMTIIARDRPRFGFAPRSEARGSFAFDSVRVDVAIPLAELAQIGSVSEEDLVRLNPHLLRRVTPANYLVWVPAGYGVQVQQAFLDSDFRRDGGFGTYAVRRGDNLGRIAELTGLSQARIRELNPQTNWNKLPAGHRLRLPAASARVLAAAAAEEPARAEPVRVAAAPPAKRESAPAPRKAAPSAASAKQRDHKVQAGETLWSLARRYDVSVEALRSANGMKDGAALVAGRTIKVPGEAPPARVAAAERAPARSAERAAAPRKEAPKVAQHVVKPGETLWSIAREYGATVDSIQTANRIADSTIVPGQRLTIPR